VVSRARFEELVAEAMDSLPDWVLRRLENVEILVEDHPPRREPNLLGLYHGIPLTKRDGGYAGVLPDTITIYQGPIEEDCADQAEMAELVRDTVVHELGHYFGLDDETMERIEDSDP